MPDMQDLPTELLFSIFEDNSLSFFDLIRMSTISRQWRAIIQYPGAFQSRLWLRPSIPMTFIRKPFKCVITVVIKRIPSTIWNDWEEDTHEMTWSVRCTEPGTVNPIINELENKFMSSMINPNFRAPHIYDVPADDKRSPISLRFCGLQDLRRKIQQPLPVVSTSWHDMLICQQQPLYELTVSLCLVQRRCAGIRDGGVTEIVYRPADKRVLKMRDFAYACREGLALLCKNLKEDVRGDVVSAMGFCDMTTCVLR